MNAEVSVAERVTAGPRFRSTTAISGSLSIRRLNLMRVGYAVMAKTYVGAPGDPWRWAAGRETPA
jgi:hypothetical protein